MTGGEFHTPPAERSAASCKPCICERWPSEADEVNPERLACQLCQRSIACPFDARYPTFNLRTQRVEQPTVHTLPYDFPPLLRVKGKLVRAAQIEMWM